MITTEAWSVRMGPCSEAVLGVPGGTTVTFGTTSLTVNDFERLTVTLNADGAPIVLREVYLWSFLRGFTWGNVVGVVVFLIKLVCGRFRSLDEA